MQAVPTRTTAWRAGARPRAPGLRRPRAAVTAGAAAKVRLLHPTRLEDANERPLLVFLPGTDGTGQAILPQIPRLVAAGYDVRSLYIPPDDRSGWDQLQAQVIQLLQSALAPRPPHLRRATVVAESFGGCLALRMALAAPQLLSSLVLLNPATSFSGSLGGLSSLVTATNLLALFPRDLYTAAQTVMMPLLVDNELVGPAGQDALKRMIFMEPPRDFDDPSAPSDTRTAGATSGYTGGSAAPAGGGGNAWGNGGGGGGGGFSGGPGWPLPPLPPFPGLPLPGGGPGGAAGPPPGSPFFAPAAAANFRANLLREGNLLDVALSRVATPTLVVCSARDRMLPSLAEGARLQRLIPGARRLILPNSGHAALLERGVDLAAILRDAGLAPPPLARAPAAPAAAAAAAAPLKQQAAAAGAEAKRGGGGGGGPGGGATAPAGPAAGEAPAGSGASEAVAAVSATTASFASANEDAKKSSYSAIVGGNAAGAGAEQAPTAAGAPRRDGDGSGGNGSANGTEASAAARVRILGARPEPADGGRPAAATAAAAAAAASGNGVAAARAVASDASSSNEEGVDEAGSGGVVRSKDTWVAWSQYLAPWRDLISPVVVGAERLPDPSGDAAGRPILFVGNHQRIGLYDMPIFIYELYLRGFKPRGLAHPGHWNGPLGMFFEQFGAVKAGPMTAFRLLKAGEQVLLFPGGAREVNKPRGAEYTLLWPEDRPDFVRLAGKTGAIIVPFAAVGADDAYDVMMDVDEVLQNPVLGGLATAAMARWAPGLDPREALLPITRLPGTGGLPFPVPPIPALIPVPNLQRLYFRIGRPVDTTALGVAPKDTEAWQAVYEAVREEVREGMQELLALREQDPYRDVDKRLGRAVSAWWSGATDAAAAGASSGAAAAAAGSGGGAAAAGGQQSS